MRREKKKRRDEKTGDQFLPMTMNLICTMGKGDGTVETQIELSYSYFVN